MSHLLRTEASNGVGTGHLFGSRMGLCGSASNLLEGHTGPVRSVAFGADGQLASGSSDKIIKLWDYAQSKELHCLRGHTGSVRSVAFDPTGRTLASGADDSCIKLWDTSSGREIATLRGHTRSVQSVAFCPSSGLLASGSEDKCIKIWDCKEYKEVATGGGVVCSLLFFHIFRSPHLLLFEESISSGSSVGPCLIGGIPTWHPDLTKIHLNP